MAVRVNHFAISLDGYGAGEGQCLEAPFGHAGTRLMEWFFDTRMGRQVHGETGGVRGVDDAFTSQWGAGVGVEIMGMNKFVPPEKRDDSQWRGWWGEEPPFRTPVLVLTHTPREPIEFANGTSFRFVDASPVEALELARRIAAEDPGGRTDIRIGGGATTLRDFLAADLVDHLHLVVVPIILGRGVRLWDGLEGVEDGFHVESVSSPSGVVHVTLTRDPRD
ncbi:dihydrofolate reductase family protein [Microlunatus sp. Y2014]|uniref:dihydrofolate reductase family protein n=1 Tax=Microlunatus sp. Y2014 TaxID=3418488 RepID=UPI003DA73615